MRISSPSRKISARKPSHLGSKIQPSPGGSAPTRLASIGSSGGLTARFMTAEYGARLIASDSGYACPITAHGTRHASSTVLMRLFTLETILVATDLTDTSDAALNTSV